MSQWTWNLTDNLCRSSPALALAPAQSPAPQSKNNMSTPRSLADDVSDVSSISAFPIAVEVPYRTKRERKAKKFSQSPVSIPPIKRMHNAESPVKYSSSRENTDQYINMTPPPSSDRRRAAAGRNNDCTYAQHDFVRHSQNSHLEDDDDHRMRPREEPTWDERVPTAFYDEEEYDTAHLKDSLISQSSGPMLHVDHERALKTLNSKWNLALQQHDARSERDRIDAESQLHECKKNAFDAEITSTKQLEEVKRTSAKSEKKYIGMLKDIKKRAADKERQYIRTFEESKQNDSFSDKHYTKNLEKIVRQLEDLKRRKKEELEQMQRAHTIDKQKALTQLRNELMKISDEDKIQSLCEETDQERMLGIATAQAQAQRDSDIAVKAARLEERDKVQKEMQGQLETLQCQNINDKQNFKKKMDVAVETAHIQENWKAQKEMDALKVQYDRLEAEAIKKAVKKALGERKSPSTLHRENNEKLDKLTEDTLQQVQSEFEQALWKKSRQADDFVSDADCVLVDTRSSHKHQIAQLIEKHENEMNTLRESVKPQQETDVMDGLLEIANERKEAEAEFEKEKDKAVKNIVLKVKKKFDSQIESLEELKEESRKIVSDTETQVQLLKISHDKSIDLLHEQFRQEKEELKDIYRCEVQAVHLGKDAAIFDASMSAGRLAQEGAKQVKALRSKLAEAQFAKERTKKDAEAFLKDSVKEAVNGKIEELAQEMEELRFEMETEKDKAVEQAIQAGVDKGYIDFKHDGSATFQVLEGGIHHIKATHRAEVEHRAGVFQREKLHLEKKQLQLVESHKADIERATFSLRQANNELEEKHHQLIELHHVHITRITNDFKEGKLDFQKDQGGQEYHKEHIKRITNAFRQEKLELEEKQRESMESLKIHKENRIAEMSKELDCLGRKNEELSGKVNSLTENGNLNAPVNYKKEEIIAQHRVDFEKEKQHAIDKAVLKAKENLDRELESTMEMLKDNNKASADAKMRQLQHEHESEMRVVNAEAKQRLKDLTNKHLLELTDLQRSKEEAFLLTSKSTQKQLEEARVQAADEKQKAVDTAVGETVTQIKMELEEKKRAEIAQIQDGNEKAIKCAMLKVKELESTLELEYDLESEVSMVKAKAKKDLSDLREDHKSEIAELQRAKEEVFVSAIEEASKSTQKQLDEGLRLAANDKRDAVESAVNRIKAELEMKHDADIVHIQNGKEAVKATDQKELSLETETIRIKAELEKKYSADISQIQGEKEKAIAIAVFEASESAKAQLQKAFQIDIFDKQEEAVKEAVEEVIATLMEVIDSTTEEIPECNFGFEESLAVLVKEAFVSLKQTLTLLRAESTTIDTKSDTRIEQLQNDFKVKMKLADKGSTAKGRVCRQRLNKGIRSDSFKNRLKKKHYSEGTQSTLLEKSSNNNTKVTETTALLLLPARNNDLSKAKVSESLAKMSQSLVRAKPSDIGKGLFVDDNDENVPADTKAKNKINIPKHVTNASENLVKPLDRERIKKRRDLITQRSSLSKVITLPSKSLTVKSADLTRSERKVAILRKSRPIRKVVPSNSTETPVHLTRSERKVAIPLRSRPIRRVVPSKSTETPVHLTRSERKVAIPRRSRPIRRVVQSKSTETPVQGLSSQRSVSVPIKEVTLDPKDIRVMVLSVPINNQIRNSVAALGATVVDDIEEAASATHVIAGDGNITVRRTPKMMIALSSTSRILHMDWLKISSQEKYIQETGHYLLLQDATGEEKYGFSMRNTLQEGKERRKEGGLFVGWNFVFCKNVAGNYAPKEDELKYIVEAAGGSVVELSKILFLDPETTKNLIIITSDPALPTQVTSKVTKAAEAGAAIFTTTWMFDTIFHQKLTGIKRGRKQIAQPFQQQKQQSENVLTVSSKQQKQPSEKEQQQPSGKIIRSLPILGPNTGLYSM